MKFSQLSEELKIKAFEYCKSQHGVERAEFCKEIDAKIAGMFDPSESSEGIYFWMELVRSSHQVVYNPEENSGFTGAFLKGTKRECDEYCSLNNGTPGQYYTFVTILNQL